MAIPASDPIIKLASVVADALQDFVRESTVDINGGNEEEPGVQGMGHRQLQAYDLLKDATDDGLKTSDLAAAMGGYDVPNAYLTLKSLVNRGLAELIPGSSPQRWRAARAHGSSAPYLIAAQSIRAGEWATYGDVSIAVRGDDRAARAVGRAAATLPDFPNAQRILQAGGVIPPGWHDSEGRGPQECRRRLEAEGVRFDGERANPAAHLAWEELRERVRSAGLAVPPPA